MPPKRPPPAASPSTPKKKAKSAGGQPSIASFFTSPRKENGKLKREASVISISDSDDGIEVVEPAGPSRLNGNGVKATALVKTEGTAESDEAMARRLARQWAEADAPVADHVVDGQPLTNGKAPALPPVSTTAKAVHPVFAPPESKSGAPPRPSSRLGSSPSRPRPNAEAGPSRMAALGRTEPAPTIDFDVDSLKFRPEDVDVSKWPKGRLPYSVLVGVYVQVASTRSRLTIVRVLTNFLHLLFVVSPIDITPSLYLLSNHLKPAYLPCELGVGFMVLSRAIKDVSGLQGGDLKRLWNKHGDPGDVAFEAKSNLRTLITPAPLVVHDVYARILSLADIRGQQSGKLKGDVVRKLMVQARDEEVRYLVRCLIGNMRIGAVRLTLLAALSRAVSLKDYPRAKLDKVLPLPAKGKKQLDPAREAAEAACADTARLVRKVYVRHPNYGDLVRGLESGIDDLATRVPLSVGIPISPMLGSITRSIDEVYDRLGTLPFTAETKLDGQRLQMHVRRDGPQGEDDGGGRWVEGEGGKVWVRLFSRHLEDMTEKYPDVCSLALTLVSRGLDASPAPFPSSCSRPLAAVAELLRAREITSLVLDAEIVAVDKDTGAKRTFQELTNRAKKDVRVEDIKVVVEVCAFDLMLLNDVSLLSSPFSHRRHLMRTLLWPFEDRTKPMLARFSHIVSVDSADIAGPTELRKFLDSVVEQKAEGLMVKLLEGEAGANEVIDVDADEEDTAESEPDALDKSRRKPLPATYEPDQRSMGWLKVKKDYLEGLGDSLDLVPIGAWHGMGRKAAWWSPFLLAARNPETGALEAVCKCISGFTDAFYKSAHQRYPPPDGAASDPEMCVAARAGALGYVETGGLVPDVWFAPSEVWEIRGADITLSPVYPAAASYLGGERGLSLRFPRFIRVREDKGVDDATSTEEFAEMFRRQMERPAAERVGVAAAAAAATELDGEGGADEDEDEV